MYDLCLGVAGVVDAFVEHAGGQLYVAVVVAVGIGEDALKFGNGERRHFVDECGVLAGEKLHGRGVKHFGRKSLYVVMDDAEQLFVGVIFDYFPSLALGERLAGFVDDAGLA